MIAQNEDCAATARINLADLTAEEKAWDERARKQRTRNQPTKETR